MATDTHTLGDLLQTGDFTRRHVGPDAEQTREMLDSLGVSSLDELIEKPFRTRSVWMMP